MARSSARSAPTAREEVVLGCAPTAREEVVSGWGAEGVPEGEATKRRDEAKRIDGMISQEKM
ncbi:MAG: hypothetical protein BRD29_04495 [Bacteroidetes bacterium QH_2_67_10]|nr:MAG: hypothetical protein BRD29_04495 [Bacteroidetes bacterium QH_2_67_10]